MSTKEMTSKEMVAEFTGIITKAGTSTNEKGVIAVGNEPFVACRDLAGVTDDELKKVRKFSSNYVAAAHEVAGKAAVDALACNKDLTSVKTTYDLGAFGSASGKVNRQHVGVAPGTDKEVITYGTNNARVTIMSGSNASGINSAIDAIKEYAGKKLK